MLCYRDGFTYDDLSLCCVRASKYGSVVANTDVIPNQRVSAPTRGVSLPLSNGARRARRRVPSTRQRCSPRRRHGPALERFPNAYVTLVSNDFFAKGALALARSLVASGTQVPLIVMCLPDVSSEGRAT